MVSRRRRNTSLHSGIVLASSCRVIEGRGGVRRQRFMELLARGWSVRAAPREVGVSRMSGTAWTSGHETCRNGVVVGFVPPLDPLTMRQISALLVPRRAH